MTQVHAPASVRAWPAVVPSASRAMRLAYLTTEYPKVSHTFIRREIHELERRGHSVLRLAIRGGAVADALDHAELEMTFRCLSQSSAAFAKSVLRSAGSPGALWKAMSIARSMNKLSDRGAIRHAAYLVEASVLLREIRRHGIEHLHAHFGTNSTAVARLIRALGGPPYSFTVHGPDEFDSPRGFSLAEKVNDAEFVVGISDYCAAQLRRWVPYEQWSKIHIVRCCVGQQFFDEAEPIDQHSRTLVCVGRLSAQKGQLTLLEATAQLQRQGVEFELVLAGDGEMRGEIERAIDRLKLRDRVRITGWIDEATVRRQILQSRALIQPSFAEGLPVVIMEALALRRPVISTAIAGIPELVKHGENGWLVSAGNVDELTAAVRRCLRAPVEQLNQMGRAGCERVMEMHRAETEVTKLEQLFERMVARSWGA
jgi:colanic acid/amylovoran biosynthesis glycosyltransferase